MARLKVKSAAMKRNLATLQKKDEPSIEEHNYVSSMIRYLNWHNVNTDIGVMRKWVITYLMDNKRKKDAAIVNRASDLELRQVSLLARLKMRGDCISTSDESKIDSIISTLITKYDVRQPGVTVKEFVVVSPMEKAKAAISKHIGILEGKVDDYLTNGDVFTIKNYIADNSLSPMAVKAIANHFAPMRDELTDALNGADDQLKEGYSHLRRAQLKKFLALINQIVIDCDAQAPKKKERVVRAKKVKPAATLVNNVRYQQVDIELGIESVKPEKLIGATECVLYDTEKRLVVHLVSDSTFTVSGTTIKNIDLTKSCAKVLRKPAETLAARFTKRSTKSLIDNIKCKPRGTTGRMNENMLIIGVF